MFACYHSEACILNLQNPHGFNFGSTVCTAQIEFEIKDLGANFILATGLTFVDNVFTYTDYPALSTYPGVFNYLITARSYAPASPTTLLSTESSVTFSLTVLSKCAMAPPSPSYTLTKAVVGDPLTNVNFAPFLITPSYCTTNIIYSLTSPTPLPSIVSLASQDSSGFVIALDPQYQTFLTITISAEAKISNVQMSSTATWSVNVTLPTFAAMPSPNTAPYYATDPPATLQVECNKQVDYVLGPFSDDENDKVTGVLTSTSSAGSIVTLSADYTTLIFNPVCRTNSTTDIKISLTDNNALSPKSRIYVITVETTYIPPSKGPKPSGQSPSEDEDSQTVQCATISTLNTFSNGLKSTKTLEADICQMIFPDVEIFSDERSVYELPKALMQDATMIIEARTREINGFLTQYKLGVFSLAPASKDIGNHTVTLRFIDKKTSQLIQSSMFQFRVLSSGKNPKNGECQSKVAKDCQPRIVSVSMQGLLTLYFPQQIMTYHDDMLNKIESTLKITFIPNNSTTTPRAVLPNITSFSITSFKQQTVLVQLAFSNPLEISASNGQPDSVALQFADNAFFGNYENTYRVKIGLELTAELPQQYDSNSGASKKTKVVFQAMEKGMTSSLIVNFFLAAFLGIAMKQIWGIINTLQILTFMPLMIPQLPSNFQVCLQILQDVSNLNVVPKSVTDWFINTLNSIKFGGSGSLASFGTKQSYYQAGTVQEENGARLLFWRYLNETGNSTEETSAQSQPKTKLMDNIAYIILGVLLILLILLAIFGCVRLLKKYPKVLQIINGLKDKIVFGVLITTITKGYLKLTLSFMRTLSAEDETSESADQQKQSWAPVIFLLIFSSLPLATLFFLTYYQRSLTQPKFKTMWGALYTNLQTGKASQYTFNAWFMGRRFIYAISIAGFFSSYSMINTLIQILMSFGLILYIVKAQPFELSRDNHIETFNEFTIIFSFYCSLGMITEDTNLTGEIKYSFGFFMIGIALLNIVFNFSIFISNLVMQLVRKGKAYLERRRLAKEAALILAQSASTPLKSENPTKGPEPILTDEERARMMLTSKIPGLTAETEQPITEFNATTDLTTLKQVSFQTESYQEYVRRKLNSKVSKGILNARDYNIKDSEKAGVSNRVLHTRLDPVSLMSRMAANGEAKPLPTSPTFRQEEPPQILVSEIAQEQPKEEAKIQEVDKEEPLQLIESTKPVPLGLARLALLNERLPILTLPYYEVGSRSGSFNMQRAAELTQPGSFHTNQLRDATFQMK